MTTDATNPPAPTRRKPTLADLMVLVAGAAASFGMVRREGQTFDPSSMYDWLYVAVSLLWGISLVGPFLLFRWRSGHAYRGAGETFWFIQGVACWVLGPPYAIARSRGSFTLSQIYLVFGYYVAIPILSVFVVLVLLARGDLSPRRLRRRPSWKNSFGLVLGSFWVCTGILNIIIMYKDSFDN